MLPFSPATATWFTEAFSEPTRVQTEGWQHIANGDNALLLAPTGSGKTLAAFLWCLDRLGQLEHDAEDGVRILYVSPLKALVYDIDRNLRAPLVGIQRAAERLGQPFRAPRVHMRTGDTSQRDRRQQARKPADILITTPESLYLILGSNARETLRTVQTVIVDEIHSLAPTKRGVHLAPLPRAPRRAHRVPSPAHRALCDPAPPGRGRPFPRWRAARLHRRRRHGAQRRPRDRRARRGT